MVIAVDKREPIVTSVTEAMYELSEVGEELPIEYVTNKTGEKIERMKNLTPVEGRWADPEK
ncbi:MAG TPA: hypothetical protein VG102_02420 [Candidatus Paceibacterota bacterium]|nr:hypothetical protein [Candidatus Paceibacterota bacterium]